MVLAPGISFCTKQGRVLRGAQGGTPNTVTPVLSLIGNRIGTLLNLYQHLFTVAHLQCSFTLAVFLLTITLDTGIGTVFRSNIGTFRRIPTLYLTSNNEDSTIHLPLFLLHYVFSF